MSFRPIPNLHRPRPPICNIFFPLTWATLSIFPSAPHSLISFSPYTHGNRLCSLFGSLYLSLCHCCLKMGQDVLLEIFSKPVWGTGMLSVFFINSLFCYISIVLVRMWFLSLLVPAALPALVGRDKVAWKMKRGNPVSIMQTANHYGDGYHSTCHTCLRL